MSALVTGAGGFAGTWLCRALRARGLAVTGWVHSSPAEPVPGVDYQEVDLREPEAVRAALAQAPQTVYHLGALTHLGEAEQDPQRAWGVNVQGTAAIVSALPPAARLVFASSCHVYGVPRTLPVRETDPTNPQGVYARTKLQGEAQALRHPNTVIARAFHHTGLGQSTRFAIPDWAAQLDRHPAQIVVGELESQRDYCDVRDICEGYIVLAERGQSGEIYNLCSGEARSMRSLLLALMGEEQVEIVVDPSRVRPGWDLVGDNRRARSLGWSPQRRIEDTLRGMRKG